MHRTNPLFCIRKLRRRGGRSTYRTGRVSRERDLSLPDECLRRLSGWADPLACSHRPGEAVSEAAPAGVNTPGEGTLANEQATGAADVTGAAGPGNTPAPVTPAVVNKDPHSRIPLHHGPWTRSGKEDVGRGMEPPATAGAATPSTQSCRDPGKQQLPPRDPGDSVQAANSSSVTANGQKKGESGHKTSNDHATGMGTHVTATGHARPRDGQTNVSAIVATTNSHSKSASALDSSSSGQKTETAEGGREQDESRRERFRPRGSERSVERERDPRDRSRDPQDRERAQRCLSRESRLRERDKLEEREQER